MEDKKNKMFNKAFNNEEKNLEETRENNFLQTLQFKILALFGIFLIILIAGVGIYFNILKCANNKENQENLITKQGTQIVDKEKQKKENIIDKDFDKDKKLFSLSLVKPVFAGYSEIKTDVKPSLISEKIKADELSNINDFKSSDIEFSANQKKALEDVGFFLTENNYIKEQKYGNDDFVDSYKHFKGSGNKYYREPDDTLFITSDVALHLYHILIDRSFQKIEEDKFQPMLKDITETLFKDSIYNYNNADNQVIKNSYKRLAVYYLIPLVILDSANSEKIKLNPGDFKTYAKYLEAEENQNKKSSQTKLDFSLQSKNYNGIELSNEIYDLAKAELDLISNAEEISFSPLFTPLRPYLENDYSQFKPRSHYTKNNILKSYFIAMMWYGRMGFSLDSAELTRDAIIITGQINNLETDNNKKVSEIWTDMAVAIEFFVGEVDDLTPYQYTDLIKEKYGDDITNKELADEKILNDFINSAITELPKPKIVSEVVWLYDDGGKRDELLKKLMQFRFMGQRFTPDAYILNQLTQGVGAPDPETGQNLPSMTTALMPISVLNPENKIVKKYIDEWVVSSAPNSDKVILKYLNKMNNEFSGLDNSVWTQNIYWNWLNSYRSLLSDYGEGYPYFMTTEFWQKKNLGTVLGSYAELKHDTLLYAKQSYAEMGGGGSDPKEFPPVPKGYVEPDLIFWTRIIALAEMTENGLKERNIMPEYFEYKYKEFIKTSKFFRNIVEKELKNEIISEDDFEKLRVISSAFERIVTPISGESTIKEKRAGIIADIHTDAVKGKILYEATGKPYIIYVAVKDANGSRLTRGLVFNHYEFTDNLDERLADEDWQAKVYDNQGDLPEADKWSRELIK
ncbi:MAG: DUF3160 domain-containing protein [Patescibacteria group bacterium]|nr:DUF3160 domain-containing protein [Patescibacteria group bacterium]